MSATRKRLRAFLIGSLTASPIPAIVSGDMSANIVGPVTNISNMDSVSLQLAFTGTPTGVITVNVSNDGVTYSALTLSPTISQPAGSAGSQMLSLTAIPYAFMRIDYARTSGSGALTVWIVGKGA